MVVDQRRPATRSLATLLWRGVVMALIGCVLLAAAVILTRTLSGPAGLLLMLIYPPGTLCGAMSSGTEKE